MLSWTHLAPQPSVARQVDGGVSWPRGYRASAAASGMKRRGWLDLGVLWSDRPAVSAMVCASGSVAAAPVRLTRATSDCGHLRAVVVNAGNANADTGKQGLADAARMRLLTANHLRLPVEQVAVASTGVRGVALPMTKIERGIASAAGAGSGAAAAGPRGADAFAGAIRATDRRPKHGALEVETPDGVVRLGFAAKGCAARHPDVTAVLCFITCDAVIEGDAWASLVRDAVAASIARLALPGHDAASDMVLGFCNGASGVTPREAGLARVGDALQAALLALAVAIASDALGKTRAVRLTVAGAPDAGSAETMARAVVCSSLMKAALSGKPPGWVSAAQAIEEALGSDAASSPVGVLLEDLVVIDSGRPVALGGAQRDRLLEIMHQPGIALRVTVGDGPGAAVVYGNDVDSDSGAAPLGRHT